MSQPATIDAPKPADSPTAPVKPEDRQALANTTLALGPSTSMSVVPTTMGELIEFAKLMSLSDFVPKHLKMKPANCMAVLTQALRWEMDPFAVAQKTYFVKDDGPPAYEAQLVNAVVYARAPLEGRLRLEWSGQGEALCCKVTGHIKGDPDPKIRNVEIRTIKTRNSPLWLQDPEQQIAYYATRAWARLYCPDILMGVYTPDEVIEPAARGPENARDVTEPAPPRPTRAEFLAPPTEADERAADRATQRVMEGEDPAVAGAEIPGAAGEQGATDEPAPPAPQISTAGYTISIPSKGGKIDARGWAVTVGKAADKIETLEQLTALDIANRKTAARLGEAALVTFQGVIDGTRRRIMGDADDAS